jgi:hypothetical protein
MQFSRDILISIQTERGPDDVLRRQSESPKKTFFNIFLVPESSQKPRLTGNDPLNCLDFPVEAMTP